MTPEALISGKKESEILGRGGAMFPLGLKSEFVRNAPGVPEEKHVVVNADESEPGTFKDRAVMEYDPHQLIEGSLIACYAAGLSQCFLYVRGEMALAQERIAQALNDAYAEGLIGKNILGTDFSVDVVLHWGAGAYIVGEETALIESLEGERGMPRLKPPYFPAAIGLYGQPTIVNNVETLANLPFIAADDAVFAIPAARLGLGYSAGGLEALERVVGLPAAKEIFLTARRFDADEALASGLVAEVRPREATIERALERPPDLMERIDRYVQELHPYRDGRSSERVLDAVQGRLADNGAYRAKPLNLIRRLKVRKQLGYYRWR